MTKQEMELSQAFTELEFRMKELRTAHTISKTLGAQKHTYWDSWMSPVEKSLANFKAKFYNIMLEIEEPE
jgi:hypothetical protein